MISSMTQKKEQSQQASLIRAGGESYYIKQKVITYAGVPHLGCNEMWVCPAFWPHFTKKVKQYIKENTTNTQGGRRFAPAPLGRCRTQRFCCIFVNVLLDFLCKMWPKCRAHPHFMAPHVGHTSICYNFLLDVITLPPTRTIGF